MELKIYSPQDTGFIQKIDWNYDELKKEDRSSNRKLCQFCLYR